MAAKNRQFIMDMSKLHIKVDMPKYCYRSDVIYNGARILDPTRPGGIVFTASYEGGQPRDREEMLDFLQIIHERAVLLFPEPPTLAEEIAKEENEHKARVEAILKRHYLKGENK